MKKSLQTLFLMIISTCVLNDLTFLDKDIEKSFGQSKIKHYMAPLGLLPYGRNIILNMISSKESGCKSFDVPFNEEESDTQTAIVMESSKNCDFISQLKSAEKAGVDMLIIINKDVKGFHELNNSAKDPINAKISIPLLIVSNETGDSLISLLEKNKAGVLVSFEVSIQKSDKIRLGLMIKMDDSRIFEFITEIGKYLKNFEESYEIEYTLLKRKTIDEEFARVQMIINCVSIKIGIDLMLNYRENCFNKDTVFDCFINQSEKLDEKNKEQFRQCSEKKSYQEIEPKMNVLSEFSNSLVLVNQSVYIGPLKINNFLQAFCGAYLITPDSCLLSDDEIFVVSEDGSLLGNMRQKSQVMNVVLQMLWLIVIICLLFVAIAVLLRLIYHKMLKKKYTGMIGNSMNSYQSMSVRTNN